MRRRYLVLSICGAAIAAIYFYSVRGGQEAPQVRTAAVTQGAIVDTVQATGKVQPLTTINVGSQVSGTVSWLGADFNSVVRQGDVIARIDPSLLQSQVEQAEATLTKVMADVRQRQMSLADSRTKLERAERLAAGGLVSSSDLEAAKLDVQFAESDIDVVQAQVVQARASLNQAKVNLNHSTILAPISGIVIERSVDVGQTVAASLSSPTLFLIAADLTKMKISAGVDEGEISEIQPGQEVSVAVDAFPREVFHGVVSQVRLQPTVVSNVTTYNTIIDVANDEMKLKPGMTANVKIEVASRADVLRVPNAALRFKPGADVVAALGQTESTPVADRGLGNATLSTGTDAVLRASNPGPLTAGAPMQLALADRASATKTSTALFFSSGGSRGEVWVWENGVLRAVRVRVGLADAANTEVFGVDLEPGVQVVISVTLPGVAVTPTTAAVNSVFTGQQRGGRAGR